MRPVDPGAKAMRPVDRIAVKHRASAIALDDMMRDQGVDPMSRLTPVERLLKRQGVKAGFDGMYDMSDVDEALKKEFGQNTERRMYMKTMLDELGKLRSEAKQNKYLDDIDADDLDEDMAMLRRLLKGAHGADRRKLIAHLQSLD